MTELVSQMTKEELRILIDETLEQKLIELFGDPDEGLELRESVKKRLAKDSMTDRGTSEPSSSLAKKTSPSIRSR